MSATGRGKVREKFDFYPTPDWATLALLRTGVLDLYVHKRSLWLEPAAGQCAIVDAVNRYAYETDKSAPRWVLYDIDPRHKTAMEAHGRARITDFVMGVKGAWQTQTGATWRMEEKRPYDVCMMNPPFELAEDFVWQAGQVAKILVVLLRIGFLGSQARDHLFKNVGVPDTFVLNRRPSFGTDKHGKKGTDSSEYAWFIWHTNRRDYAGSLRRLSCQDDT